MREGIAMTNAGYATMLQAQSGVCLLCKEASPEIALAVDHDHSTGEVRALLCKRCNLAVALVERIGIAAVAAYLGE
ncbi:MAG: endonuclease VII domain-containing protein [Thermoplasmata archaeon]|nr:endonuclease VII domain-containing protein [Thermoplasmata archaeon]